MILECLGRNKFFIEIYLTFNIMLVSGVLHSNLTFHTLQNYSKNLVIIYPHTKLLHYY